MRIAIVNDLALAREILRRLIQSVPEYSIAWTAIDGAEAVKMAAQDRPDIILMDLVMPVLDGVEATRRIMADSPCPILLVTSSVTGNFNQVYAAMGYGGLDAVNTPTLGPQGVVRDGEAILARIAKFARSRQAPVQPTETSVAARHISASASSAAPAAKPPLLVALGASTGGPEAVAQVLSALPANLPASVVVIQHIAADFAPGLASWLQRRSQLPVRLAQADEQPQIGTVLLAGSEDHLVVRPDLRLAYSAEPRAYPYRPSVDVFMESLAAHWPGKGVAALLTGMGSDGARGLLALKQAGWHTIAQDQATCVVYGMPKAAADLRAARRILPLSRISAEVVSHLATAPGSQSSRK